MAKLEWGQKRTCSGCGTRFYDMRRLPVICPKCNSTVDIDLPFKVRRSNAGSADKVVPMRAPAVAAAVEADDIDMDIEEEVVVDDGGDADDAGLMEDASDLGEDEEDMAEVMEHMDETSKDEL